MQVACTSVMELITDELIYLQQVGVATPDGHVRVKVQLLFPTSDYPGLKSVWGKLVKKSPSPFACYKSWFCGIQVPSYKTVYDTHARYAKVAQEGDCSILDNTLGGLAIASFALFNCTACKCAFNSSPLQLLAPQTSFGGSSCHSLSARRPIGVPKVTALTVIVPLLAGVQVCREKFSAR